MKSFWFTPILLACCLISISEAQPGKNFQADTPEYARALEVARHSNAWYWADQELPNWAAPATVRVKKGQPDHGQTDFLCDVVSGQVSSLGRTHSTAAVAHHHRSDVLQNQS